MPGLFFVPRLACSRFRRDSPMKCAARRFFVFCSEDQMSAHGTSRPSLHCRDGGRYRGNSEQTAVRRPNSSAANDPMRALNCARTTLAPVFLI